MKTNGIVLIDKPEGLSSARVVDRVKKIFRVKKAGHTGTLDPFATGLLPVAIGKATRISRFFLGGAKRYHATVRLGIETDTYDKTGQVTSQAEPETVYAIAKDQVLETAAAYAGVQQQVAPSFSALKHEGKPLYELARQGKMIQKPPRTIEIYDIRVTDVRLPEFDLDVHCSGGTYIRSLAFDMGRDLACGAHLSGLCRTGVGQFSLDQAVSLEALGDMDRDACLGTVISMADCLSFMPLFRADAGVARKIGFGQKVTEADVPDDLRAVDGFIRVVDAGGRLLAVLEKDKTRAGYNYCCVFNG